MKKIAFSLGALVLLFDRLTKIWAESNSDLLDGYRGLPIVEGYIKLQLVGNKGIAFGLLHSVDGSWKTWALSVVAVIAVIALVVSMFYTPERERRIFIAYGLLIGGILGNFYDRIFKGEVTDFITLHWQDSYAWPTFNIADASITTGVFLLLVSSFLIKDKHSSNCVSLLALAALFPSPPAGDADVILARVESEYRDIQSLAADFVQSFSGRGVTMTETGKVMMKRPGLMRWEYRDPDHKIFVADGKRTFFYLEEENQLMVSTFDLESSSSPLLFFLGRGGISSRYESSVIEDADGLFLRLVPINPDPEVAELIVEVNENDYLVRRIIVRDPIGQQNEYILTNLVKNVHIAEKQFEIEVPEDVEIIEQ